MRAGNFGRGGGWIVIFLAKIRIREVFISQAELNVHKDISTKSGMPQLEVARDRRK